MKQYILVIAILLLSATVCVHGTVSAEEKVPESSEHGHDDGHDHEKKHKHKHKKHKHKKKEKHDHDHDHDQDEKEETKVKDNNSKTGQSLRKAFEKQQASIGVPKVEMPAESKPAINVDESNFKSIFTSSVESRSTEMKESTGEFEMEIQGRYVSIDKIGVSNAGYSVNYEEDKSKIPMLQIGGAKSFWRSDRISASYGMSAGYGFKEARLSASTPQGTRVYDIVGLHVVPVVAGIEFKRESGILKGASLFATPQAGIQWLRQAGSLDGMEQNRWIFFYGARAGMILFSPESKPTSSDHHWFDGVSVSGSLHRSTGSQDYLNTTSFDVGVRMSL